MTRVVALARADLSLSKVDMQKGKEAEEEEEETGQSVEAFFPLELYHLRSRWLKGQPGGRKNVQRSHADDVHQRGGSVSIRGVGNGEKRKRHARGKCAQEGTETKGEEEENPWKTRVCVCVWIYSGGDLQPGRRRKYQLEVAMLSGREPRALHSSALSPATFKFLPPPSRARDFSPR